jgi:hypothetical protein
MAGSPKSRTPRHDGLDAQHTARRTYRILAADDGAYVVEIRLHDADAPLRISGFITEDEAEAWIREHQ